MNSSWADFWDVSKDIVLPESATVIGNVLLYGSRKPIAEIQAALAELRPIADLQWLERKVEELW